MATDYVEQVAGALIEQLKAGTAPWVKPWQPGERFMPYNPTTGNEYHGMNALWLMSRAESHGYGDARWMTYRQALESGAQVRKGEKGTAIQYWKWQGLEPVRDEYGRPVLDAEGNLMRQLVRYERPRVWSAAVFNAAQIDGLPPAAARPALAEWERRETAEAILANAGAAIRHVPGDRAFYRLAEDTITLPARNQFPTADGYYATVLHELGHWTGHPSRLARDLAHPFGSEGYAREELRAEIASLMLSEQLGIGHDPGQHAAYVASWIEVLQRDPREIFRAAVDAEKITGLVRSFERERSQQGERAQESTLERSGEAEAAGQGGDAAVRIRPPVLIEEDHPSMTPNDARTYLAVPYAEKDDAKALGAKWDRQAKAWFVPAGVALDAFQPWLPVKDQVHIAVEIDPRAAFVEALRDAGLQIDGLPRMDGQLHRVPVEGDRAHQRSGAYTGHLDGRPSGFIQNFRTGAKTTWTATAQVEALGAQDRAQLAAEAAQKRHDRAAEREHLYERTAQEVEAIWTTATPVEAHPYLAEKGVGAHGLRQDALERLLVPVRDADGKMWSIQRIGPDGFKKFYEGGRIEGGHHVIGNLDQPGPVLIAEGYATAATLHELTDMPAVMAFNAGNLAAVAQIYRERFPDRPIYIAGDNDHRREAEGKPNVGREKAEQAAALIGGLVLLPAFGENDAGSDWNDLVRSEGREAARQQLRGAIAVAEREQIVARLHEANGREQEPDLSHSSVQTADRTQTADMEMER